MTSKKELFEEVKNIIAPSRVSVFADKKVGYDKSSGQYSIKIPKSLALRAGLTDKSRAKIVFRPNKNDFEKGVESELVIFFGENKSDETKKKS
ncbi:MAG: hypothetical protein OQK82_06035 [Candidatus Pacearchaeota archaeon]|nr:hypothetical protein [Candidatus Pacearchaeota archaeon]